VGGWALLREQSHCWLRVRARTLRVGGGRGWGGGRGEGCLGSVWGRSRWRCVGDGGAVPQGVLVCVTMLLNTRTAAG
jgi:hypothetical protein